MRLELVNELLNEMRKIKDLNRMKFGFRNMAKTRLLMRNKLSCQILITNSLKDSLR